ncbi:thymidine kinase [Beluga whale alphaherpesvirus 1]|uniref:Thymidine kinase n=1 Tax=Beluga whale alphaherpesvirus 1 TaxID=1434720 RepID=A0A286MM58_9ALPH|nr:thymidine kinase [Beluga whale alphaherpesvirus 1]ASW27084.1 thymidine kinase [Beluga whale alphaherpesvirus 1]
MAAGERHLLRRVYLDGSYGVGKTTACRLLAADQWEERVVYFPEPMSYWRTMFGTDALRGIWSLATRRRRREITEADAGHLTAYYQSRFAAPYLILHAKTAGEWGSLAARGPAERVTTVLFDRHPVAACVCFPFARYVLKEIDVAELLGLMSTLPAEPPGTNLIVCSLTLEEQSARVSARARDGERQHAPLATTLHNVYTLLVNTIRFVANGDAWREGWPQLNWSDDTARAILACPNTNQVKLRPDLADTLFAPLKTAPLCDRDGALFSVHAWALDALAEKLRGINVLTMDMAGTPKACVAAVREMYPIMLTTATTDASLAALKDAARDFASEMAA